MWPPETGGCATAAGAASAACMETSTPAILHAPDEKSWGMSDKDWNQNMNITLAGNPGGSLRPYVFACNRSLGIPRCPLEPTLAGTSRIEAKMLMNRKIFKIVIHHLK